MFSLILARSSSLQARLGQTWQRIRSLHVLWDRLPNAVLAALLTIIAGFLLLPGQQRTEILLSESADLAPVSRSVQAKLLDGPAVLSYGVRTDEQGRVLIEIVTRSWVLSGGPMAAELVPEVARRGGFNMKVARRGSRVALPLGALVGLLVLFAPLYRKSRSD